MAWRVIYHVCALPLTCTFRVSPSPPTPLFLPIRPFAPTFLLKVGARQVSSAVDSCVLLAIEASAELSQEVDHDMLGALAEALANQLADIPSPVGPHNRFCTDVANAVVRLLFGAGQRATSAALNAFANAKQSGYGRVGGLSVKEVAAAVAEAAARAAVAYDVAGEYDDDEYAAEEYAAPGQSYGGSEDTASSAAKLRRFEEEAEEERRQQQQQQQQVMSQYSQYGADGAGGGEGGVDALTEALEKAMADHIPTTGDYADSLSPDVGMPGMPGMPSMHPDDRNLIAGELGGLLGRGAGMDDFLLLLLREVAERAEDTDGTDGGGGAAADFRMRCLRFFQDERRRGGRPAGSMVGPGMMIRNGTPQRQQQARAAARGRAGGAGGVGGAGGAGGGADTGSRPPLSISSSRSGSPSEGGQGGRGEGREGRDGDFREGREGWQPTYSDDEDCSWSFASDDGTAEGGGDSTAETQQSSRYAWE